MARRSGLALPPGTDPRVLARLLHRAHDDFLATGRVDEALRPVVLESWRRSLSGGLDPESSVAPVRLDAATLDAHRSTHPLAGAMPVIRRLLVEPAAEAGLLVAVTNASGQLLWVEGCPRLRSRAESMHFLPGADWSEPSAGTNAPGTALAVDAPVQILGAEHLARPVTPWSCTAAPIHDPGTGALLGVLDVSGGSDVASPQTLALVRATVAAVEAELRWQRVATGPPTTGRRIGALRPRPASLEVLGRRGARFRQGTAEQILSRRHSEVMILLAEAPEGLSAGEVAVALSEEEYSLVTIRAELSRLRTLVAPLGFSSRPYRLAAGIRTDVAVVRRHLRSGRLRPAAVAYAGPVLPWSSAPGVESIRRDLHAAVRSALLAAGDADALLAFADTAHGREDHEIWRAVGRTLPAGSVHRARVGAHLDWLDRTFG